MPSGNFQVRLVVSPTSILKPVKSNGLLFGLYSSTNSSSASLSSLPGFGKTSLTIGAISPISAAGKYGPVTSPTAAAIFRIVTGGGVLLRSNKLFETGGAGVLTTGFLNIQGLVGSTNVACQFPAPAAEILGLLFVSKGLRSMNCVVGGKVVAPLAAVLDQLMASSVLLTSGAPGLAWDKRCTSI